MPMPTPNAATTPRSGQNGSGQRSGHREKPALAHSQPAAATPAPLPTPNRAALRKRGGWIEFRQKNGRRYARRRAWEKQDGQWVKVFKGREAAIPIMTEEEYKDYVYKREQAKRIRVGRN